MHFDLSPTIILDEKNSLLYGRMRVFLYIFSFLLALYLAFRILFPSLFFEFSFNNPRAKSNTITNPRDENLAPLEKGLLNEGKSLFFNTSLVGTYSTAIVSMTLDKKYPNSSFESLSVRKSYNAFLYPEGEAMGFRDGTLLKNKSDFYIVSDGKLRKFAGAKIIDALGFPVNSFLNVAGDELTYNSKGDAIGKNSGYPDDSLFLIQNNFYQLQDNKLKKFISDFAFSTHYESGQAIKKNADFLKEYEIDSDPIGFSEGSLLSYADSIYVVEGGKIFPIDNPLTFSGKGFDWNDVIQASADEIAFYEKEKLFTIASDHPSGTIFNTTEDHLNYLIIDGQKRLLPTENIFSSWVNTTPVPASKDSLDIKSNCQMKKSFLRSNIFKCSLPIVEMQQLIGSDYVFSLKPTKETRLDFINVEFKKDIGFKNFRFTAGEILNRIKNNYAR
ncbi:MAG TPA: hypothetical protein DIC35_01355 [Candidatus Moranbacteria bacterium]|nr:hypothetical protein [Candidatus Moranbacteria bacterium]